MSQPVSKPSEPQPEPQPDVLSALPPDRRWRCSACGNLTRFDVTRTARVVEYVHLDLAGHGRVEERTVLEERIEQVRCRWCDRDDQIELVPRPDTD